jgi:hypothetical protein
LHCPDPPTWKQQSDTLIPQWHTYVARGTVSSFRRIHSNSRNILRSGQEQPYRLEFVTEWAQQLSRYADCFDKRYTAPYTQYQYLRISIYPDSHDAVKHLCLGIVRPLSKSAERLDYVPQSAHDVLRCAGQPPCLRLVDPTKHRQNQRGAEHDTTVPCIVEVRTDC